MGGGRGGGGKGHRGARFHSVLPPGHGRGVPLGVLPYACSSWLGPPCPQGWGQRGIGVQLCQRRWAPSPSARLPQAEGPLWFSGHLVLEGLGLVPIGDRTEHTVGGRPLGVLAEQWGSPSWRQRPLCPLWTAARGVQGGSGEPALLSGSGASGHLGAPHPGGVILGGEREGCPIASHTPLPTLLVGCLCGRHGNHPAPSL